jgi:endogenous inhibitor of DNA gyrase (YacG/DUF329 family)
MMKRLTRVCARCGKRFVANRKTHRWCSNRCRKYAWFKKTYRRIPQPEVS